MNQKERNLSSNQLSHRFVTIWRRLLFVLLSFFLLTSVAQPRYDMSVLKRENLNRGLVAIRENGKVYLSWRTLSSDAVGEKFDTIHSITEELYKKALEHLDALSEQAIIWKEYIGNYNFLSDALLEFYGQPCEEQKIDWSLLVNILDDKGNPMTAHTTNLVPFCINRTDLKLVKEGGKLADIAPTILELLGAEKPAEMTGASLIEK